MNRLTERFSNGQVGVYGCGNNCKYDFKYCHDHLKGCPTINEIYEKLAYYEDLEEAELLCEREKSQTSAMWKRNFLRTFLANH